MLAPDRWARVRGVLEEVVVRPAADRPGYLTEVRKAEPDIYREVESLLAAHAEASGFLEPDEGVVLDALRAVSEAAPALVPGTRFGAFEILAPLGAGGMGQVYRARDTRLGRDVAIKLLPDELAADARYRERFEREALAISRLTHPHICVLHDVGRADFGHAVERQFLVMELVQGETLAARIAGGPLPVDHVLTYGIQVAEALAAAHGHGIVHRDLKPANIMLTSTGVKLLDFGLARLRGADGAGPAASDPLSEVGVIAGTLPYMAPEQLRGERADARADLFSLGAVLYEMLSGRRAFAAASRADLVAAILEHDPPRLADTRPHIPPALDRLVRNCLAKDPAQRWQHASDVALELRGIAEGKADLPPRPAGRRATWPWLAATAGLIALSGAAAWSLWPRGAPPVERRVMQPGEHSLPRSIAVLPFKPLVATDSDERMQLGMTEALINQLSRIRTLRVEPLARVRRYSAVDQDPLQAARDLAVDAVVEGHFQRTHGSVHVRTRLLRTADGTALATNDWREPFSDIFEIQKRAAQSVMSALELTLTAAEHARVTRPDTTSVEAYRHYLFGRHLLEIRHSEQIRAAVTEFSEAVRLDPGYAAAHAALSLAFTMLAWLEGGSGIEAMGPAKDAALKAIAIDEGLALAHSALARIHQHFDFDPLRAQREHVRAMELGPQEPWVLRGYWFFLLTRNAFDEALELNARDLALDPTLPLANRYMAQTLCVARRYDECVAQSQRTLLIDPADLVLSYTWMALCLEQQGKQRDAVEMWERSRELRGRAQIAEQMKRVFRERGWAAYWRERLKLAGTEEEAVEALVRLGGLEDALHKLGRLLERRSLALSELNEPQFDPLRSDPRFQALRRRAGYSDEMNALLKAERPPLLPASANASTR